MATAENPVAGRRTTTPRRRQFNVEEYERMAKVGILGRDERVELIDGEILVMSPIGSRHAACVDRLTELLIIAVGNRARIRVQGPVRLNDQSEPEPDVSVLKPRDDYYASAHPEPADIFLLFEVMDRTALFDRGVKLGNYARAGVPEVWLIDLNRELVEVYRRPTPDGYSETRELPRGQGLATEAFPEVVLGVDAILG